MYFRCLLTLILACALPTLAGAGHLEIAVFDADVTPTTGSPLGGASVPPMRGVDTPLSARGLVIFPADEAPVVLCAVDWIGIGNSGYTEWREALAEAANTTPDRVAVHVLHQHDAPFYDPATDALLADVGLSGRVYNPEASADALKRTAESVAASLENRIHVTHIGHGKAKVEKVASNRRILGEDGKVKHVRWTAMADPEIRAYPEGVIDPYLRAVSFWRDEAPVAVVTYYATHPQSFYRTGLASADFPGLARSNREAALPKAAHIHFNGASGNIGAGKYNDGSPENRPVLAERMEAGMRAAFENSTREAVMAETFGWRVRPLTLPLREEIDLEHERALVADASAPEGQRIRAAREIAWAENITASPVPLSCLQLGPVRVLHLPGELFVEYQLAAQEMAPSLFVCMAAYGDYGPGYIGTEVSYEEGGYETQLYVSRTAPSVEGVIREALEKILAD